MSELAEATEVPKAFSSKGVEKPPRLHCRLSKQVCTLGGNATESPPRSARD